MGSEKIARDELPLMISRGLISSNSGRRYLFGSDSIQLMREGAKSVLMLVSNEDDSYSDLLSGFEWFYSVTRSRQGFTQQ